MGKLEELLLLFKNADTQNAEVYPRHFLCKKLINYKKIDNHGGYCY